MIILLLWTLLNSRLLLPKFINNPYQFYKLLNNSALGQDDFHQIGLSAEFLADYLVLAGFSSAEQVDGFDLFDELQAHQSDGFASGWDDWRALQDSYTSL